MRPTASLRRPSRSAQGTTVFVLVQVLSARPPSATTPHKRYSELVTSSIRLDKNIWAHIDEKPNLLAAYTLQTDVISALLCTLDCCVS
jgi:hypothetical protein